MELRNDFFLVIQFSCMFKRMNFSYLDHKISLQNTKMKMCEIKTTECKNHCILSFCLFIVTSQLSNIVGMKNYGFILPISTYLRVESLLFQLSSKFLQKCIKTWASIYCCLSCRLVEICLVLPKQLICLHLNINNTTYIVNQTSVLSHDQAVAVHKIK